MFDNTNHYESRTGVCDGATRYYVSFMCGQGVRHEVEVSRPVHLELMRFRRAERNLRRWDERHMEQSVLTEAAVHDRASRLPAGIDEAVFDRMRNGRLRSAIKELPAIQRRRFILYHWFGLTYGRIARMEGRSNMSVCESVRRAEEKIRKKLKKFEE